MLGDFESQIRLAIYPPAAHAQANRNAPGLSASIGEFSDASIEVSNSSADDELLSDDAADLNGAGSADETSSAALAMNAPAATPRPRTKPAASNIPHLGALYGGSSAMQRLFEQIGRLGRCNAPVMILGESGAGKELVAATLHEMSERAGQTFLAVNCGAIPETLIESELFGHERGSFTGAARLHRGFFERASGGTLLLDEVTEMPLDMQVRLLRVLETGKFCRVGGDTEVTTDVRILAASNRDLQQAVASGRLRADLMYRLCVIPLHVPPLREREGDSLLLAEQFMGQLNTEYGSAKTLSENARQRLSAHSWPGNVRELKNVMHRAFVLSDSEIEVDIAPTQRSAASSSASHASSTTGAIPVSSDEMTLSAPPALPFFQRSGTKPPMEHFTVSLAVGMSLDDAERALITATLRAVKGSKSEAARVLGICPKTLYNRLLAYRQADAAQAAAAGQPLVATDGIETDDREEISTSLVSPS